MMLAPTITLFETFDANTFHIFVYVHYASPRTLAMFGVVIQQRMSPSMGVSCTPHLIVGCCSDFLLLQAKSVPLINIQCCCMHFHHGIEGTVGDVGGIMKVMQPTTERKKKLLYCNAMLSAENSLYLQTV